MRTSARNALAFGFTLALAAAACTPEPKLDPETFPGGVLRVNYAGGAEDILLMVNPDGSLAGAEGAASVDGWSATRSLVAFTAIPAKGAPELAFALPAAAFGPDYAGQARAAGNCIANCTREATAWWARGKEKLALPK